MAQIPDTYKSIAAPSEGLFKDNGSRFIALAWPVGNETEVKEIVDDAIAKAERISFRNLFASKKAEDNSDYTLLREKDFE